MDLANGFRPHKEEKRMDHAPHHPKLRTFVWSLTLRISNQRDH